MPVRFDVIRRSIGIKVIAVDMLKFVKICQTILFPRKAGIQDDVMEKTYCECTRQAPKPSILRLRFE